LLHAVLSYGTNWSTIAASHTPKRATLALKNRYSTLRLRNQNARSRLESAAAPSSSPPILPIGDKTTPQNTNQEVNHIGNKEPAVDDEVDNDSNEDEGGDEDEYECSPSSMVYPKLQPTHISTPVTSNSFPDPVTTSDTAFASDLWTSFNESNDLLFFPMEQDSNWMREAILVDHAAVSAFQKEELASHGFLDNTQDFGAGEMELDMSFVNGKWISLPVNEHLLTLV
jgi:hypothetical protein